jgi:hypothetical protein
MGIRTCIVGALLASGCLVGSGGGGGDEGGGDVGGGSGGEGSGSGSGSGSGAAMKLPPANARFDYQLGGPYTPAGDVQIVSRDRQATPAAGAYNICYVNGFQIQPDEESTWLSQYPDLILRDANGNPVIDADWDEMLIDISTPAKRTAVAAVVGGWIDGCATAGFDALEIDNLDTFSRSGGRLTEANAIAMMRMFSDAAHARGLAVAQKNSAELVGSRDAMATDFVVAEECNHYSECGDYTAAYGDHVIVIEYTQTDFNKGCTAFPNLSIVLRDRNLVTPSQSGYVFAGC